MDRRVRPVIAGCDVPAVAATSQVVRLARQWFGDGFCGKAPDALGLGRRRTAGIFPAMRVPADRTLATAPDGGRPPAAGRDDRAVVERPVRGRWLQLGRPRDFEWNVARLPFRDLHPDLDGLRIVHVTDLHLRGAWAPAYDRLMDRLSAAAPDLLLVTGDFVDSKRDHAAALPVLYRLLTAFRARLGCFGVIGNHDTLSFLGRLDDTTVRLIGGQRHVVPVGRTAVELIGLPGAIRKDLPPGFADTMPPRAAAPPGAMRVVLSHFPDHLRRTAALRPDLFLAGHTHGGQVCLPGMVPIIKHDTLPRRLCSGAHRVETAAGHPTWLVVGRGLGTTTLPVRVFCPPEVVEIVLKRET